MVTDRVIVGKDSEVIAIALQQLRERNEEIEVLTQERDNALLRVEELEHELSKREMAEAGS